ncbi:MAG TPA: WecB/TagA/CpsF family glycosyltransferase [Actinomycetota bacterium]|nr:WecB/TagA/CpsF family glycosyltransferase [Actinomycetota bacterium]
METVDVLGVPVARLTAAAARGELIRLYERERPALVAYANAHTLNLASRDSGYRAVLRAADIVLNDGAGLAIAGRVFGKPFPANLNGTDFNPVILEEAASRGWPVFFLGAKPGVADEAARRLTERIPGLRIVGTRDGYFRPEESDVVARQIAATGAGLVMVAMGNPLQERWLSRHLEATGARLGVGVGAFLDFSAEVVSRAPAWMNKAGLEWVYRLAQEPRRMWRRYVLGNPLFLARVLRARLRPH